MKNLAILLSTLLLICFSPVTYGQIAFGDMAAKFTQGPVYGTNCGIAGTQPELRTAVEALIKDQELEELNAWLDSPSAAHQTYAAEAFIRLSNDGLELSEVELKKVKQLKSSDQIINACRGCIHDNITIKEALTYFEL